MENKTLQPVRLCRPSKKKNFPTYEESSGESFSSFPLNAARLHVSKPTIYKLMKENGLFDRFKYELSYTYLPTLKVYTIEQHLLKLSTAILQRLLVKTKPYFVLG